MHVHASPENKSFRESQLKNIREKKIKIHHKKEDKRHLPQGRKN